MIQICSGITSGRVLNGEFYAQRLQKLIYLHLLTGCFMKISLQSSELNALKIIFYVYHYYLLGKGGYVFGSVGLSVCLFVCRQHYSKSYERIGMKSYGGVLGCTVKNWLNFGGDLGILRSKWAKKNKNTMGGLIAVA